MRTLIFNGSPRQNGGTAQLIGELKRLLPGEVRVIDAYRAGVSPCVDCRYCWTHDSCAIDDGMQEIYRLIGEADCVVIASPIYFAELSGPLLSLLSRLQFFWIAQNNRRSEPLPAKRRRGAALLVDAGDGSAGTALAMAKRLLRTMGAELTGSVYFSGTENRPIPTTAVPESVFEEVRALAKQLTN